MRYLSLILLIFILDFNVEAACSSSRLNELREEAKKIEFSYDYTKKQYSNTDEGTYIVVDFKITAYNLNENIKPLIIYNYYNNAAVFRCFPLFFRKYIIFYFAPFSAKKQLADCYSWE